MSFPDGFLWGAATAAHQVEGGNVNNDSWLLEHAPGSHYAEVSGDACDHYHRYPDDITLVAELGLNAYRFSLEWSRIEPEESEFSRAALEHYRRMLATCHENGLTPILTFHHFTSPRWIAAQGGWKAPRTAKFFARFCERAMRQLGDLVPFACTINEPNLGALLHQVLGLPEPEADFLALQNAHGPQAVEILRTAHRLSFEAIKGVREETQVGLTVALTAWEAEAGGEAEMARLRARTEDDFLEGVEGDFIGVQNYTGQRVGPNGPIELDAAAERTQMGYGYQPEALGAVIRRAVEVTGLPVYVTENGVGTDDDTRRVEFIERALRGLEACLRDGIDVRGYTYWSLFDNFEWSLGYRPTFGIVGVDRETQVRTVKPSGRLLGQIARANGPLAREV